MKRIRNIYLAIMQLSGILMLAFSCTEEEDGVGVPTITSVVSTMRYYKTSDGSETDSLIVNDTLTEADMTSIIVINGTNFIGVKRVLFNDVEANLSEAYITPTKITLCIPRLSADVVDNTITVETSGGKAIKNDFKVVSLPLKIYGIANPRVDEGKVMAISGENFDTYRIDLTCKVYFGSTEAKVQRAKRDSLFVVVPTGIGQNVEVKIVTTKGLANILSGHYKDTRLFIYGMLNPYVEEGGKIKIFGENFNSVGVSITNTKVLFGSLETKILSVNRDTIEVVVPKEIAVGTSIYVKMDTVVRKVQGLYKDNRLCTFETYPGVMAPSSIIWENLDRVKNDKSYGIEGAYWQFTKEVTTAGDKLIEFNAHDWAFNQIPNDVFLNQNNYVFKFDVRTAKPMTKTAIRFEFNYEEATSYLWEINNDGGLDTQDKWTTITIDMSEFPNLSSLSGNLDFGAYFETAVGEKLDISFDNLRIEKK